MPYLQKAVEITRPSLQSLAQHGFDAFYYGLVVNQDCVLHIRDEQSDNLFDIGAQVVYLATFGCGFFLKLYPSVLKEMFCHASVYEHFDKSQKNNTFDS